MAEKKDKTNPLTNIFAKTETGQPEQEQIDDPVEPRGVGLRKSEWAALVEIGKEFDMTPHALVLWATRDFIRRYRAGEIKTQTKKSLPG